MDEQIIINGINEIDFLEKNVRDYINTPRYQRDLIHDLVKWNQICSSLDTIGDTLYSIKSYLEFEYPNDGGLKYLLTYGLLQALFIQQDAISHLSEAFDIEFMLSDKLRKIRQLRNAAIGHPTKQNYSSDGHTYHNYISRVTLSKQGFTLMRSSGIENNIFEEVSLYTIINDQVNEVKSRFQIIVDKLEKSDKMHKEKYEKDPLTKLFTNIDYMFEKIYCNINSENSLDPNLGLRMLKDVQGIYLKFEKALEDRGEISEESIGFYLKEYKYALSKLRKYFEKEKSGILDRDARIYHFYISEKHKFFKEFAKEIDESYKI